MADVFLSHADEDEECVRAIARVLDARGISAFVDKDANLPRVTSIDPGEYWKAALDHHLERAALVVVLWTEHSVDARKHWVRYEADHGMQRRNLISVTLGAERPDEYGDSQSLSLDGWAPGTPSRELDTLVRVIVARITPLSAVRDRVIGAFEARYRGDHESAAKLLERADEDFRALLLDEQQRRRHSEGKTYRTIVLDVLGRIARDLAGPVCPPVLRRTLSGSSFLPVVDAVLELPVERVREALQCCPLRNDVRDLQTIRVGVVIRSADDVRVQDLALTLSADWEQGALALHCYLMVVNSNRQRLCREFEEAATRVDLRAKGIALPLKKMNREQLEGRLRTAMHDLCLTRVAGTDDGHPKAEPRAGA